MNTIHAAQLIYTRVEPAYSPNKKTGFQTVYKTETLSPTDVDLIEKSIQCFRPNQSSGVRLQFFRLDDGSVVLTHTRSIEPHPEIVDKTARSGAFLTHCLIIKQPDFDLISYNPFIILKDYKFLGDVESMIATFGKATGVAPIEEIKVTSPLNYLPLSDWSGREVQKLVELAGQRASLKDKRRSLLFLGKDKDIYEALETAFFFTPSLQRLECTFDTHIDNCSIQPGLYWAVSIAQKQKEQSYIVVDTAERRIVDQIEDQSEIRDLYVNWLRDVSARENISEFMRRVPIIQGIARAFQEQQPIQPELLAQEEVCQEFMNLYQDNIRQGFTNTFSEFFDLSLSHLIRYLQSRIDVPVLLNMVASQNLNFRHLSQWTLDWVLETYDRIKEPEWKQLRNFALKNQNMRLLHLCATLSKKSDTKARDEALQSMDVQTFKESLAQLMSPIDPADYVSSKHLRYLLSSERLTNMTDEQYLELVKAIIRVNAVNQLDAIPHNTTFLTRESLGQLVKIIRKRTDVPDSFKETIYNRWEKLSQSNTQTLVSANQPSKGANIMAWFKKRRILCPYCLTEVRGGKKIENCPYCESDLPIQYVHGYEDIPPFFAQVFGWSQAGKTVFLSALTLTLINMSKIWPQYAFTAANELSQQKVKEISNYIAKGYMPPATDLGPQDVYIMLLHNMERWGSRALVTRDCAGELFDSMQIPVEQVPYLLNAPTTFMLISLPDLQDSDGRNMTMLLNSYIETLMKSGVDFNKDRRKLVVVFTKADLIPNLPLNLRNYLRQDPIWTAISRRGHVEQLDAYRMQAYMEEMERVSNAICDWVSEDASGANFIQLAKNRNIETRYSLISSTGADVSGNSGMLQNLAPRRVLDPYFWALELQSRIP